MICGSYVALNKSLLDVDYPLPKIDYIFSQLSGNVRFTKIELKDGYMFI